MSWPDAAFHRALVAAVLVGAGCGMIGVQVVLRRQAFFTMALTHATFPGVVLAAVTGISLHLGGLAAGLLAAVAVTVLGRRHDPGTATGIALAGGFALGVALLSAQDGFTKDLTAYLVGSILTVGDGDLLAAAVVAVAVAGTLLLFGKELRYTAFDRSGARAAGYPVALLDLGVLVLIEAVVVTTVPAAGTILTLALIVAPAGAARLWTDRAGVMTAASVGVAVFSAVAGLQLSRTYDVAAGGAISLVAAACFGTSALLRPCTGPAPGDRHRPGPAPAR